MKHPKEFNRDVLEDILWMDKTMIEKPMEVFAKYRGFIQELNMCYYIKNIRLDEYSVKTAAFERSLSWERDNFNKLYNMGD